MLQWYITKVGTAVVSIAFMSALLSGCSTFGARNPVPQQLTADAIVWPGEPIRAWGDATPGSSAAFSYPLHRSNGPHTDQYLALSGGGPNGAFGVGYLIGWSASGTRPSFDLVTGVSVGALIAPMAFLGADYDQRLRDAFELLATTGLSGGGVLAALFGAPAAESNTSLIAAIALLVDEDVLDAIAAEHRKGRRLLVGTTNLDLQRPVVWDIGAIAASGIPDRLGLVRQVLLASASIPGVFAPVLINVQANGHTYDEMHVDGGVTEDVLLYPPAADAAHSQLTGRERPTLHVLFNGDAHPNYLPVTKTDAIHVVERALPTMIKYLGRDNVEKLRTEAAARRIGFDLIDIPDSFEVSDSLDPGRRYIEDLLDVGIMAGKAR